MDGWMDEWMNVWMDKLMDGWMVKDRMDRQMDRYDEQLDVTQHSICVFLKVSEEVTIVTPNIATKEFNIMFSTDFI